LEGICFALRDVLESVQQNSEPIIRVNVSGGFTKSEVWVQILADVTRKKMVVVQSEDASAVGAAFIAMKASGLAPAYPAPALADRELYLPNPASANVYAKNFNVYRQLYLDLKETMHKVSTVSD